jgi:serine phosphatase RsbU (regulator of sigma subunit)
VAGGAAGGAAGGGAIGAGLVPPPLAAAGAIVAPGTGPGPAGRRHPLATVRGSGHGEGQSPLVRTVTKIVDVVPAAIRVLIGALALVGLALALGSRLLALRARRLARQRRELLEDVGLLQGALLPALPARLGPVATSAAYRPAAGPAAGGDFYDVFALEDGQIGVIVGDLSGHGRQALPHTALVRFTLRAYLEAGMAPRNALQRAAAVLERQLAGSFATVVAATYHPRDRRLVYACAGHPPPVVVGSQTIAPITVSSAPPIGAGLPTGIRQTSVAVPGGALICFYTDGVIEARVGEDLFGPARLATTLSQLGPNSTASTLLDRVAEDSNRHSDDMAACLLSIDGDASPPSVKVEELELDRHEAASERPEQFLRACHLSPGEITEIMRSARITAERTGSVLLSVRLGEGRPQVSLRHDNVAFLDAGTRERASAP